MKHSSRTPLLLSISMALGIVLGTFLTSHFGSDKLNIIDFGGNKLNNLLQLVENNYVDTVDMNALIEDALPEILSKLDPHSAYIPAKDSKQANEELKGSFSGIGISFRMENDTATVMSIIHGGPAEKVGMLAGDRIISANDTSLCKMESTEVMKHIKGEKNSNVRLEVVRHGNPEPLTFNVVRGDIPVESVDAAYIMDDNIGYIRVRKFGEQTYAEMITALARLSLDGMKSLIIDLRGNTGGYMHIAIQMANEFLPEGRLIVYTEGSKVKREDYVSNGYGSFKSLPIVVLVDEISASASEIFAGAIQDNDRGTIIGRRSFGKGLVQQPMEFKDGSVVRLTIARYHTPSGRCIQKPYEKGHGEEYENELLMRYQRGEFYVEDSIRQDGPVYHTTLGRSVYGGGGIRPDIFIPDDSTGVTSYYKEAAFTRLIAQFCFEVVDQNRETLNALKTMEDKVNWMDGRNMLESFARYGQKHSLPRRNLMLQRSKRLFRRAIYSGIIYNSSDMNDYMRFLNQDDPTVLRAIEIIHEGKTFPTKQDNTTDSLCVQ
ncbi:MAG: S41 family peptidase [Paraprevotella sp.]|nr:S41 family peptidase [Paraprevotella sp.]